MPVGSLRLNVSQQGDGEPLLLIGGLGNASSVWTSLVHELRDVHTIAVDAPGMGSSSMPSGPLSMRALAAVYGGLIETLGLQQATVVGFSFGGAVAQQLAHQSPELVRRLVLCATGPGLGGARGEPAALQELATPWRYYSGTRLRRVSPGLYGGRRAREPDNFRGEQRERLAAPPSFRGYYYQLSALTGWSSLKWLQTLDLPTLVIAGDDDPIFPVANALLLASQIRGAQIELVPGGGHLLVIDHAEDVARFLERFVHADADSPPPRPSPRHLHRG